MLIIVIALAACYFFCFQSGHEKQHSTTSVRHILPPEKTAQMSSGSKVLAASAPLDAFKNGEVTRQPTETLAILLSKTGYDMLNHLILDDEDEVRALNQTSDYEGYSYSTMRQLAEFGDDKAMLYVGMHPRTDNKDAIKLLTQSLVQKGYHVALFEIAQRYELEAQKANQFAAPIYERVENAELTEEEYQYISWLALGAELNDPLSRRLYQGKLATKLNPSQLNEVNARVEAIRYAISTAQQAYGSNQLSPVSESAEFESYVDRMFYSETIDPAG